MQVINWTGLIDNMESDVLSFARGTLSGRQLYRAAQNNNVGGSVRNLLRNRGVSQARSLARKALGRRGINV